MTKSAPVSEVVKALVNRVFAGHVGGRHGSQTVRGGYLRQSSWIFVWVTHAPVAIAYLVDHD